MIEERSHTDNAQSRMKQSRAKTKRKNNQKVSPYSITMENYLANKQASMERIDPRGLLTNGIYASFSGVIEEAEMFANYDDLKIHFTIQAGNQWHDQTPQVNDRQGESTFCQSVNKKIVFSLGFDCLMSCMYIVSWPQLVMTFRSFDFWGQSKVIGYAHVFLPSESGSQVAEAYIYSVYQEMKWYHKWLSFLAPSPSTFEHKDFEKIVVKGHSRQTQSVRPIGKIRVRSELLLRNFHKFGYR